MTRGELARALREAAYLEGDFVLRSGRRSRYYLDKYRFETRPDLLGSWATRSPRLCGSTSRRLCGSPGPSSGRSRSLPRVARLGASVPDRPPQAKEYGTANRIEGVFAPGELVCLVEDVVTAGGAALEAVSALRDAGLRVGTAVCVVDREEGGHDALARHAVRLRPSSRPPSSSKPPQIRMVERYPTTLLASSPKVCMFESPSSRRSS